MSEAIMKGLELIESKLAEMSVKAEAEQKANGKVSSDTQVAIDNIGIKQRELADEILQLKQRSTAPGAETAKAETWGDQFVKSTGLESFQRGMASKVRVEVKNTMTGSDTNVAPDRKPGIVPGAFAPMTLESFLPSAPTSSNAIEFTKESAFTNSAAEVVEGAAKAESALTWALVNMPISTVAHWIKISKQLAADNAQLAAYVDTRMRYGVNMRVETQLGAGNGTAPNISGILDTGNFTAHGYLSGALGTVFPKLVLIRKMIADLAAGGDTPTAILLNPADWAAIEIELLTTAATQTRVSVDAAGNARLFGLPVIQSIGITADSVVVGNFAQAYMVYNRQDVTVELSDSDSDNFTKNLVTIRAERRLALATERPAAVRAGDLTPPAV